MSFPSDRLPSGSAREASSPAALPPLPEGRFEGRATFQDFVRLALAHAAEHGWKRLILCDEDFADWPLGERAAIDALQSWASSGRTIRFVARDYRLIHSLHPRLVQWRQHWSHIVEARTCSGRGSDQLPSAFWSDGWTLERLDDQRDAMVATQDAGRRVALHERIDGFWRYGQPGFASSVLGL
ncbi:hypothetical protein [Hydrogenophaga sp. 5NK40-0174]|uniref:hypothetical protein n=1 Tax=Hydrogenophaga sp. 5NK40-0174 TaxID=3127649 RepID=UPI00310BD573